MSWNLYPSTSDLPEGMSIGPGSSELAMGPGQFFSRLIPPAGVQPCIEHLYDVYKRGQSLCMAATAPLPRHIRMGKVNNAAVLPDELASIPGPGPLGDLSLNEQTDEVDALPGFHFLPRDDLIRVLLVHGQGHPQMVVVSDGDALNTPGLGTEEEGFGIR